MDPDIDCWSVASADRLAPDGARIPAGTPHNDPDDVPIF